MEREGERGRGPGRRRVGGELFVVLLSLGLMTSCTTPRPGGGTEPTPPEAEASGADDETQLPFVGAAELTADYTAAGSSAAGSSAAGSSAAGSSAAGSSAAEPTAEGYGEATEATADGSLGEAAVPQAGVEEVAIVGDSEATTEDVRRGGEDVVNSGEAVALVAEVGSESAEEGSEAVEEAVEEAIEEGIEDLAARAPAEVATETRSVQGTREPAEEPAESAEVLVGEAQDDVQALLDGEIFDDAAAVADEAEQVIVEADTSAETAASEGAAVVDSVLSDAEERLAAAAERARQATGDTDEATGEVLASVVNSAAVAPDGLEENSEEFLQRIADLVAADSEGDASSEKDASVGAHAAAPGEHAAAPGDAAGALEPAAVEGSSISRTVHETSAAGLAAGTAALDATGIARTASGKSFEQTAAKVSESVQTKSTGTVEAIPSAGEAAVREAAPEVEAPAVEKSGNENFVILLLWGIAALVCVAFLLRRRSAS